MQCTMVCKATERQCKYNAIMYGLCLKHLNMENKDGLGTLHAAYEDMNCEDDEDG